MDSDIDFSFDDTLPGYDDAVAKKFKPKGRGRQRPLSVVSRPTVEHVNSPPAVLEVEDPSDNFVEVNGLSPPNGVNPTGDDDSDRLNKVGLVSAEPLAVPQEVMITGNGFYKCDLLEGLAVNGAYGCPNNTMKQNSNATESASLQGNPFDDIYPGQRTSSGYLEEDVPLDNTTRVEIHNSFTDVDLDDAQFNVVSNEEACPQYRSFSDETRNDNEIQSIGGTKPESCDTFNSDLLGAPSVFPPANDYFSVNHHSTYSSVVDVPSATLPDDDMQLETAQGIPSERVDDCVPAVGNKIRKPPRAPRKRKSPSTQPSLVDGDNDGLQGEVCSDAALYPDASNNQMVGDANLQKKGVKRSRKSDPDGVKHRSRNEMNETSSEQSEKPKKKFSHSTRGSRKKVNPKLLATTDAEIDLTVVPLKDLIHRADILERDSKKAPNPSSTPSVVQRYASPSPVEETIYGWHNFESNQPEDEYPYDDYNMKVQEDSTCLNYHSYMRRTPTMKWTKLDTELFYQGIRQFGTDFTVIQQHHFPGRTRDQIKSKYKKEEREQPIRLTEAIENRAGGVSHFQQVIEQFKAAEAKENQDLGDDLDEVSNQENDVVAKDDADSTDTTEMQEAEKIDDYDEFGWGSSYRSL